MAVVVRIQEEFFAFVKVCGLFICVDIYTFGYMLVSQLGPSWFKLLLGYYVLWLIVNEAMTWGFRLPKYNTL